MSLEYSFKNDYSEGAHPRILEALGRANLVQDEGYGEDIYSLEAANRIRDKIKNPKAAVHFVTGGTQANLVVLAAMMRPYHAVIAPITAHPNTHEAGAVEATGHKIIPVESKDGKLKPEQVTAAIKFHSDEHMVKPKVVFISQATELGTVYTKQELEALSRVSRENGLHLYMDGARLGAALTFDGADVTLPDLTNHWCQVPLLVHTHSLTAI